jgi:hypothetical protein
MSNPLLPSLGFKDDLNLSATPRAGVVDLRSETDSLHIPSRHDTACQLIRTIYDSLPNRVIIECHAISHMCMTTYHQLPTIWVLKLYVPKTKTGISG